MSDALPAMTSLPPLGGDAPRVDSHGRVTLAENAGTAIASFTCRLGQEDPARAALRGFVAHDLPAPGQMSEGDPFSLVWTGPDQWFVLAPHDSREDLAAQLKAAAGDSASVTEQNDAWCRFDLSGEGLAGVFELLCPINIRAAKGGEATRTTIDHLGCFVLVSTRARISVLGPRSSAGSLHHALMAAIRSAH